MPFFRQSTVRNFEFPENTEILSLKMSLELFQTLSCNQTLKNEVLNLKNCADDLRLMLDDCRESIEEETKAIQKEFLNEIDVIKNAKLLLEKKLYQLKKMNESLNSNLNESHLELKKMQHEIVELKDVISQKDHALCMNASKLTSLEAKYNNSCLENSKLKEENNDFKAEQLSSQENINFIQTEREILGDNLKKYKEKIDGLELELHETKTSEDFLQEQISELEEITEQLREQMNKQHNYNVQKEISLKKENKKIKQEFKIENQKLKNQVKLLEEDCSELQAQLKDKKADLENINEKLRTSEASITQLHMKLKANENQLSIEKNTVESLENENRELYEENSVLKRRISNGDMEVKRQEKSKTFEQKQSIEIENTLQKYFNQRLKEIEKSHRMEMDEKSNQIADLEILLKQKQRRIVNLEIKKLEET